MRKTERAKEMSQCVKHEVWSAQKAEHVLVNPAL